MKTATFQKRRAHVDRLHGQWLYVLQIPSTSESTIRRKFRRYLEAERRLWRDATPRQLM